MMSGYQQKKVLITVKTYPTPAKKGIEVSCTAGITDDGKWIRLFPIPFRLLGGGSQFKKYQWLEIAVTKASDYRPESYHLDIDSIKALGQPLPTSSGWQERKAIVMPLLSPSLCYLVQNRKETGATLGMFKPKQISEFVIEKEESPNWTEEELAILSQASFLDRKPFKILEKIPYKFIYAFTCNDPECKGHRLSITDWEVGQLYRRCKGQYGNNWERYFRQKFETEMILGRNTHFYVGTLKAHPDRWIIVGLFYPPL